MSIFKCKMCGGSLKIEKDQTICKCEYCGTRQTLPKLDNDKKANLYDRANHFRRNNEYDKAMSIYEKILNEDIKDAEAYWSLVLCKYGVEYVDDPSTHNKVPTVNRAQFTSVFADEDYKSAIKYADNYQKEIYEQEAKAIDEIQKGILAISEKEEPFDVFICYKETDNNGRRTPDSVLATELYNELTREGFKVFFSRITLEDKLGTAYEPYIFAALNSSKVMVVVGTKPEYFNAVWVKNEWSRYLSLIKNGEKKILIPAYKDMDPYDLPEEFSHLQAQDMSKLGFMQDLIRGIKKIVQTDEPKKQETVVINNTNVNIEPLLKRAFIFLEDSDWQRADDFCEQVLNQDPENAYAYLGKLMADLKVKKQDLLGEYENGFENNQYYLKVRRYADKSLNAKLDEYIKNIQYTNNEKTYQLSLKLMDSAKSEADFISAAESFELLDNFKDSKSLAAECRKKADIASKNTIYETAVKDMQTNNIASLNNAIRLFNQIPDWKDSSEQIAICNQKIKEIEAEEKRLAEETKIAAEKASKKRKKIIVIATPIVCVCIVFVIVLNAVIIPNSKYNAALDLYNAKKYDEAISAFTALNGYKDSKTQIENCNIGKYGKVNWNRIKSIKIGDTYTYGAYEQDNNISNGKEAIEWTVLAKDGTSILVISNQALDCQPYCTNYQEVTWESSFLRKWLNNTFLNAAFSENEQAKILTTNVSPDANPIYDTAPGNATEDKVFLLSIDEANKYFSNGEKRACGVTAYATSNAEYDDKAADNEAYITGRNCYVAFFWWLRSPGCSPEEAALVYDDGSICYSGVGVHRKGAAVYGDKTEKLGNIFVRPAMWIDTAS